MPLPPWTSLTGLEPVVAGWLASGYVRPCLTADHALPPSPGAFVELPDTLPAPLAAALRARGVSRLYKHQAEAYAAARAGRHLVVATPTASGKSLCFHLPVLEALAREPDASAIYLYPTKALSRDQEAGLRELLAESGLAIPAIVYDGDTPGDARRAARERSPIVMTNPDMLHAGILPHHAHWARTLQKLRYVVVDELHTYRGVFGSHVAHVIARLRRAARFHGSDPVFLSATATIGNPREHAARLFGVPEDEIALVDESGAPRGPRRLFVFNPPVVNAELGVRASALKSAVMLASDLVRAKVPTLVFGQSRNAVEIMLKYLRDRLAAEVPGVEDAIMAYRGGYLPEARRRVERGLREGEIRCVVATNALELGIDVGDLDAVICAGYPGSVAGAWQRFGRAGRRGAGSIAVMIASSAPLDQYLAGHPDYLLHGGVESARIDPSNTEILIQHLKCAAFELPFLRGEAYAVMEPADTGAALDYLAGHGVVHASGDRYHWSADAYPANHVSLRTVGWDNFVIIDKSTGSAIAELDFRATHTMLHEQAIYQHDGEQYQVEKLDYENHKAFVTKVVPDYFTTALSNRRVSVMDETARQKLGRAEVAWGEVSVVEKVVGYKKIKFHTHENAGYGDVRLPDIQKHTTSFWLTVPEALAVAFDAGPGAVGRAAAIEGLRGIAVALETVSALALMCDPRDLGQTIGDGGEEGDAPSITGGRVPEEGFDPTLFLFDSVPGGVGLAERIHERADELVTRARRLVRDCPCPAGCPLCVGAAEGAGAIRKRATLGLLEAILHAP
jgi:DEAD/DEAH box helicase domain-containing protein